MFIFCAILIIVIGCKKRRQKKKRKEELDKVIPFRRVSAFDATSVRRGMPIKEPKGNELTIKNPIYTDEYEVMQMKDIGKIDNELQQREGTTEVTYLDDVANVDDEYDDTPLVHSKVQEVSHEEHMANKLVTEAITLALESTTDKTPLIDAEDLPEELDEEQQRLTRELEHELAQQLPQTRSNASLEENEEIEGLETIIEEPLEDEWQNASHVQNEENDFPAIPTVEKEDVQQVIKEPSTETSQPEMTTSIDEFAPPMDNELLVPVDEQFSITESALEILTYSLPQDVQQTNTVGAANETPQLPTLVDELSPPTDKKVLVQIDELFLPLEKEMGNGAIVSKGSHHSMPSPKEKKITDDSLVPTIETEPTEIENIPIQQQEMETENKSETSQENVEEQTEGRVDEEKHANVSNTNESEVYSEEATTVVTPHDQEIIETGQNDEQTHPPIVSDRFKNKSSFSYEVEVMHKQLSTDEQVHDAAKEPESDDNEDAKATVQAKKINEDEDQQVYPDKQTVVTSSTVIIEEQSETFVNETSSHQVNTEELSTTQKDDNELRDEIQSTVTAGSVSTGSPGMTKNEFTAKESQSQNEKIENELKENEETVTTTKSSAEDEEEAKPFDEEMHVSAENEDAAQLEVKNDRSSPESTLRDSDATNSRKPTKMVTFAEENQQDMTNNQTEKLVELNKIIEEISITEDDDQQTDRKEDSSSEAKADENQETHTEATVDETHGENPREEETVTSI